MSATPVAERTRDGEVSATAAGQTKLLPPKPPETIPPELMDAYTMGGKLSVTYLYYDGTYPTNEPVVYQKATVDAYIDRARQHQNFYYKKTDACLYRALKQYPIVGQRVAIMGSVDPWYESVCLAYRGQPVTIEYNTITSNDPRLTFLTVAEHDAHPQQFDAAFSISSFEHDGLGRYGDPLNPNGDVETMAKMKTVVRPSGLLFLALPVGRDALVWNAHRIYGSRRLPWLLAGWKIIDFFGVRPGYFQPIIVLQNTNQPLARRDRRIEAHFYRHVRFMEATERVVPVVTKLLVPLVGGNAIYKIKTAIHSRL